MSDVIHNFTTEVPEWQPRVTPVDLDKATPEQLEALHEELIATGQVQMVI